MGKILDQKFIREAVAGNTVEATIDIGVFPTKALVLLTASGRSTYDANVSQSAGIFLFMEVGGDQVCEDNSFEAASINLHFFRAAISHNFVLAAGRDARVRISLQPEGVGGQQNKNSVLNATYVAMAVEA